MNVSVNNNDNSVSCENEERVSSGICSNTGSEFFGDTLKALRLSNVDRIIVAQINVNSIRNKFDALIAGIQNKVDILLISETKLGETFPTRQFSIDGFTSPYRLDRNGFGGGLLVYVREDIPSKFIKTELSNREGFFIKINLRNKKWVIGCSYNPHNAEISSHMNCMGKAIDSLSSRYENFLLIGDFNAEVSDVSMKEFCDIYSFKNLIKEPTCFKNPANPKCIDLMLTNRHRSFQNSCVIETGLSDFHKMTVTVLRAFFKKAEPKVISYRDYKNFTNDNFRLLLEELGGNFDFTNETALDSFLDICREALNKTAPLKQKYVRANKSPFMNKTILKAIMKQTRLRNRFLKDMSDSNRVAYNTQRNYCVSLVRKAKKSYYSNLDHKKIVDNKTFWKTIKPFFTDKGVNHDNITLVENEETVSDNKEISETLNNFFSEVVTNLNLPQYHNPTVNVDDIEDPVARTIEKSSKNHPSIRLIKENYRNTNNTFHFENVSVKGIEKELKNLLSSKAAQNTDIPTKVIKANIDIFTPILLDEFNKSLALGIFPSSMKLANITPVFKTDDRTDKSNYRPISILPNLSKVFEKCIYNQLSIFFDKVLSKYQCGFRKGFSA